MQVQQGSTLARRALGARLGISLLNLFQPGLGLVRLAHYRAGFALIAVAAAASALTLAAYALGPPLEYKGIIALAGGAIFMQLVTYLVAIVLSWRWSREDLPRSGWLWRWYGVLGIGVLMVAIWLPFPSHQSYYRGFLIASESMAPTLMAGDRLVGRMRSNEPLKRGDVVVVRVGGDEYVWRVAAIPGDTIAMQHGIVVLNGSPVAQQSVDIKKRDVGQQSNLARRLRERFPGEATPHYVYDLGATPQDNTPEAKLGAGDYFLLGDNRDNALDSRFGHESRGPGIIEQDQIQGRGLFRYWRRGEGLGSHQL